MTPSMEALIKLSTMLTEQINETTDLDRLIHLVEKQVGVLKGLAILLKEQNDAGDD